MVGRVGWAVALITAGWILLAPNPVDDPHSHSPPRAQTPGMIGIPAQHPDGGGDGPDPAAVSSPPPTHAQLDATVPAVLSMEEALKAEVRRAWVPHTSPISLDLRLTPTISDHPSLQSRNAMRTAFGFNLNKSNHLPLDHHWPDYRDEVCLALRRGLACSWLVHKQVRLH